jgi:hypothetical protein
MFNKNNPHLLERFLREERLVIQPFQTENKLWIVHLYDLKSGKGYTAHDLDGWQAINDAANQYRNVKQGLVK